MEGILPKIFDSENAPEVVIKFSEKNLWEG